MRYTTKFSILAIAALAMAQPVLAKGGGGGRGGGSVSAARSYSAPARPTPAPAPVQASRATPARNANEHTTSSPSVAPYMLMNGGGRSSCDDQKRKENKC